jgi:hypothetical protein
MEAAWIGVIGVLIGAVAQRFLSHWDARAAFQREKSSTLDAEARQHLEQVYRLVEDHRMAVTDILFNFIVRLEFNDTSQPRSTSKLPWTELKMRIALYVPELLPQYQTLEQQYHQFSDAMVLAFRAEQSHDQRQRKEAAAALQNAHTALAPIYDAFHAAIQEVFARRSRTLVGHQR